MNNKASLADAIYGPIFILFIAMVVVLGFYVWSSTGHVLSTLPIPQAANATYQQAISNATDAFTTFDYMIPFLVGGMLTVSLVFAFKRGASVAYIGLALVFWVLALLLAAVYSNVFETFSASFSITMASFPILAYIMANIRWIILAWLFLISVVMFTRNKKDDLQGSAATEAVFQ